MPAYTKTFSITGRSAQEIYDTVAGDIERVMGKASLGEVEIDRDPAAFTVSLKSSMFSATLSCRDGEVAMDGKISLLAAPFRSKIDEGIERWLNKAFKTA